MLRFQAKNDVRHRIHRTIDTFRSYLPDHKSVPAQQFSQRIARKIVEMRRRVDLAPFTSPYTSHETTQVAGCKRKETAPWQDLGRLFNVKIRALQMFNRIPHANDVGRDLETVPQEVFAACFDPQHPG